jgi:predicted nucleic acid-binding protein
MIIVCDCSPLIALALCDQLALLDIIFEAMTLYWEKGADYLLIDEDKGRRFARKNGITIIGSLGTLLYAKKMNLIPAVKPLLHILRASNIQISGILCEDVLKQAKE